METKSQVNSSCKLMKGLPFVVIDMMMEAKDIQEGGGKKTHKTHKNPILVVSKKETASMLTWQDSSSPLRGSF